MGLEGSRYLKLIFKRAWIIVLLPAIAILTASYVSIYVMKPVYEASTTLVVASGNSNSASQNQVLSYSDIQASQELAKSYKELVNSKVITEKVLKELNIDDITADQLSSEISAEIVPETVLIRVIVKDNSPNRAKLFADKVSDVFIRNISTLMGNSYLNQVDNAEYPLYPVSPKIKINILLAAFVGLFCAVAIIFISEYLDDTLKTSEDIEKSLGLLTIGVIPDLGIK